MRRAIVPAALAALFLSATTSLGTDYPGDAGAAIGALARDDIHGFVSAQPQMGPLSLLGRAPLAALAGPGSIWAYRLGALACLLGLLGLAALVARRTTAGSAVVAAILLIVNPVTIDALHLGHPEELLGAALCVAALLLARGRPVAGAVALGAALATKQWALIAIAPVLLAAPAGVRARVAVVAGAVAAALVAPIALADPHAFVAALHHPAFGLAEMRTGNLWGPLAVGHHVALGSGESTVAYLVPGWLQHGAHAFVAILTLGLGAAALRARRAVDPLALLALLLLARCALDPWDHAYYHAPFLAALIAWEVLEERRAPWLSALAAGVLGIVFAQRLPIADVLYALWALPMLLWLSRRALGSAPLRLPRPLQLRVA